MDSVEYLQEYLDESRRKLKMTATYRFLHRKLYCTENTDFHNFFETNQFLSILEKDNFRQNDFQNQFRRIVLD